MPASVKEDQQAEIIFEGTIKKAGAATMERVSVNDRTAIVTVDQIIQAPKAFSNYGGRDITVELSGRQKVQAGQQMIFYATGAVWGESVMVKSLKQEPVKRTHAAMLSRGGDPVAHKADSDLRKRFDEADIVVSGKVSAVRLPAGTLEARSSRTRGAAASMEISREPVSEHDPKWREAVVEVDDVHKGEHSKRKIVVRFPASTDVRWYKAPKFHPGQQGYFMLHKKKVQKGKAAKGAKRLEAAAEAEPEETAYVAENPMDFQPYSKPGGIKNIIEVTSDEKDKG